MNPAATKPRFFYADVLRAIAIFAVILLHNADLGLKMHGNDFVFTAIFNGLTRFCVPMFVALSGALLLKAGKEITIKDQFTKRLPKLVIPLFIWSIIYIIWANYRTGTLGIINVWGNLTWFYKGPVVFHFWFLYMMIGIYLIYPIINLFITAAKPVHVKYFLWVWFTVNCVFGIVDTAFGAPIGIDFSGFTGYIGYFVVGYYLQNFVFSKQFLNAAYVLGCLAFLASVAGILLLYYLKAGKANDIIESDFTPELPFAIAGLFLWMKNNIKDAAEPGRWRKLITSISLESYGIYIIHVLLFQMLFNGAWRLFDQDSWSAITRIPVVSIIVFVISYLVVRLIRLLPLSSYII